MTQVTVNRLPQTAPISDMRNRQNDLLTMAEHGPVVLLSRSKPAAILLSPAQWDAIAQTLEEYQQRFAAKAPASQTPAPNESQSLAMPPQKKNDALAEIAALAQPYGPSDLARNFDKYMGRVSDDESAD